MSTFLIISGAILLCIVIIGIVPTIGAYIVHRRRVETNEFIYTIQHRPGMDDTQGIALPALGEERTAEDFFHGDPLFSHSLPEMLDMDTPLADDTLQTLVNTGGLTGVGVDIDAEWLAWNLVAA